MTVNVQNIVSFLKYLLFDTALGSYFVDGYTAIKLS